MAKKTPTEADTKRREKTPKRARLQNFEARDILRSQMKPDPENPRYMDDSGRVGLRRLLENLGLVDTVTWNEATGELAGGHQRLDILDADEGYYEERDEQGHLTYCENDYYLTVAVINVTQERQREINLALNNPDVQGMYDLDMMSQWVLSGKINVFDAGFTEASIEDQFGPDILDAAIGLYKQAEVLDAPEQQVATDALANPEKAAEVAAQVDLIKQRKKEWVEKNREGNDPDHMLIIVFVNPEQRGQFLQQLEFDPGKRFLPFDTFVDHFGGFAAKFAVQQAMHKADYDADRLSTALKLRTPSDYQVRLQQVIEHAADQYMTTTNTPLKTLQRQEPRDDTTDDQADDQATPAEPDPATSRTGQPEDAGQNQ